MPRTPCDGLVVMVHVPGETVRRTGRADTPRETADGRTGVRPEHGQPLDERVREAHCAKLDQAARAAAQFAAEETGR
ncbi:hypothetical protein [Streptomyces sp. EMB26]